MGTKIFDFLTESFLFNDDNIESLFTKYSDNQLKIELSKYREFVLTSDLESEIINNCSTSHLNVFSGQKYLPHSFLKQSAFYVEKQIINDPLFSLTHISSKFNNIMKGTSKNPCF